MTFFFAYFFLLGDADIVLKDKIFVYDLVVNELDGQSVTVSLYTINTVNNLYRKEYNK